MSDLIDRQAAIEHFCNKECGMNPSECEMYPCYQIESIQEVPSAEPERKKGEWIKIPEFCGDDVSGFIDNHFSCSECKKEAEINPWGFYILSDFCPNCGADMRGEEE